MKLTIIKPSLDSIPPELHKLFDGAKIYDSSCSKEARVIYIEKDNGYFLKSAPKGTLKKEYDMTAYFSKKGLSKAPLAYLSDTKDWLLTERICGSDATHDLYISDPKRLASTLGQTLRFLHSLDMRDCPNSDSLFSYFERAENNYKNNTFDLSYGSFDTVDAAYQAMKRARLILKPQCLIHGDYCLPNVIFDNWKFSGFIDLGNAGTADRHIDIYWGAWTLKFNLKTDRYRSIFYDAYGADMINDEAVYAVGACEVFG